MSGVTAGGPTGQQDRRPDRAGTRGGVASAPPPPPWYEWPVARRGGRRRPAQFSRTDRVGELVREVVASELERIGDERLELVTVTDVVVDGSLEHAAVYYSAMQAESEGRLDEVPEALEELRWRIQQVVNREVRLRKTPQIEFRPDDVLASALRVEEILRRLDDDES